ncbi:MAG: lactate utilization protein [Lachnospiraceae bacterium]
MNPKQQTYAILAESVLGNFKKRGIDGYYCDTSAQAVEKALQLMEPNSTIAYGGSETLKETGMIEALSHSSHHLILREQAVTKEEKKEIARQTIVSDYFFMSSNAITLDGELINMDGTGSRLCYLIYGPEHVIILAGMNKIVVDVETGIKRVKNVAAPPNGVRLNTQTPCALTGHCNDCYSPGCMCCECVITRKSRVPGRIKVILIGEELGY